MAKWTMRSKKLELDWEERLCHLRGSFDWLFVKQFSWKTRLSCFWAQFETFLLGYVYELKFYKTRR